LPPAITDLWNLVLVSNIESALLWLTSLFGGVAGIAIIVFTVVVRTLMLPLSLQQIKSQKAMAALQPRLKELQQRYAGDRGKIGQEQIKLYKEAGVNPAAGCLPLLIQMPIWFSLYSALITLSNNGQLCADPARMAESHIPCSDAVAAFAQGFLWIPSLGMHSTPSADPATWPLVILPIVTAITQWMVQKMSTMPSADPQQQQMNRMMEFMPFMFLMFSFQVAAGLTLYWVVSNLYSIAQQYFTVGWGSLPFLGNKGGSPAVPLRPNGSPPATQERQNGPRPSRRRGSTSSSGRKKRGK
jgi:YidC/Oxa1 family membrane protein insertase